MKRKAGQLYRCNLWGRTVGHVTFSARGGGHVSGPVTMIFDGELILCLRTTKAGYHEFLCEDGRVWCGGEHQIQRFFELWKTD